MQSLISRREKKSCTWVDFSLRLLGIFWKIQNNQENRCNIHLWHFRWLACHLPPICKPKDVLWNDQRTFIQRSNISYPTAPGPNSDAIWNHNLWDLKVWFFKGSKLEICWTLPGAAKQQCRMGFPISMCKTNKQKTLSKQPTPSRWLEKLLGLLGCLDLAGNRETNQSQLEKKSVGPKEVKVLERFVFRLVPGFPKKKHWNHDLYNGRNSIK